MKKRTLGIGLFLSGFALTLGAFLIPSNKVEEAKGYTASSLPTTIDLNDTTAANIRSYYSSLNSLATNQRQGTNLLKNLKTILKNGQKYYSYENGTAVWQMYEITDRDWSKSPASSTTYGTYNSSTNKITDYVYGTSNSSGKNNPYLHALYTNRNVTNETKAWGDHTQTNWGINREHVWPKAEGFDTDGAGGARGDPMHLMAANGYANNIHSNYYYGYVDTSSSYTNCGSSYSYLNGNLRGKSKTKGGSTNVFEPQDSDKGDIARSIFYMVARYNYLSGSDSDGIDTNNPNLTLTSSLSDWSSSGYTSSKTTQGKLGILEDLLAWHHADPVDEFEKHRNNLLYTNFTNNRNPFIDFPEWVDFIWGTVTYSGSTYKSYSSTPTGYATPSTDTINGYNSGGSSIVSVTGVSLDTNSTSVEAGKDVTLTATVAPSNATDQSVSWSTSNVNVATVSGGIVHGVAEGSATITVTTNDGNKTAQCSVTVTAAQGGDESQTEEGSVTASGGALEGWTASGVDSAGYSGGAVKFDSSGDNVYKTDIFSASVAAGMTSLTVTLNGKLNGSGDTSANTYTVEALDSSGNVLTSEAKTDAFTGSNSDVVFSFDSDLTGCTGIKVTYTNKGNKNLALNSVSWVATYEESEEVTISSIAVKTAPSKTVYVSGEYFNANGLVITVTYSNNSEIDVPYEDNEDAFEFTPSGQLITSNTSVTISYGGKTTTQSITVNTSKTLSSISVTDPKTSFEVGDTFEFGGLVTAHYSDNSTLNVTSSATFSGYNMDNAGEQTVTVSYTEGILRTTTYTINVVKPSSGDSTTATINWDDTFNPAFPTTSATVNTESTAHVDETANFSFTEQGIYRGTSQYSVYLMFCENKGFLYNTTDLGTVDSISITYSSGTSLVGKIGVYFGTSELSTYTTTSNQTIKGQSETDVFTNPTTGKGFFQISTSNKNVQITKIEIVYHESGAAVVESISAVASKTFYVGETITKSDIVVRDNLDNLITDFSFTNNNYQFVYGDATSGGALTNKVFTNSITSGNFTCSLTVQVQRKARVIPGEFTDTLDRELVGVTGTSYENWTGKTSNSPAVYAGNSSGKYTSGTTTIESLQIRSNNNNSGIVSTTSGGNLSSVSVTFNSGTTANRTINIYGKNTAYSSAEDLYSESTQGTLLGTIVYGTSTSLSVSGSYKYVGLRSNSGSIYLDEVNISYSSSDSAENLANYIMFEDTNNQCSASGGGKFNTARGYFENLSNGSTGERYIFMNSEEYIISTARERFLAWAAHEGKTIDYINGDYVISGAKTHSINNEVVNTPTTIIIVISVIGIAALGGYLFIRRYKQK